MGKYRITFKCDGVLRVRKSVLQTGLVSHPSLLVNVSVRVVK